MPRPIRNNLPASKRMPMPRRASQRKKQILGPPLIPPHQQWRDEETLLIDKVNEVGAGQRHPRLAPKKRKSRIPSGKR